MRLDVLLCDHGQVSGDKLFVSGGGIDRMYVPVGDGPYVVNFSIAGTSSLRSTQTSDERCTRLPRASLSSVIGRIAKGPTGKNRSCATPP